MPSYGYDGPITADVWALMQQGVGTDYAAATVTACRVTATTSGAQVGAGAIAGWGVLDVLPAPVGVALAAPGSGTSWWMIVARRTWGSTKATTFVAIPAGTGARPTVLPARNTTPGTADDQPLALVGWTAGQSQPGTVVDLRVCGPAGQQLAFDQQALQYLERPGRLVRIGTTNWVCGMNLSGTLEWVSGSDANGTSGSNANGTWRKLPDGTQFCQTEMTFPANPGASQAKLWTFPATFVVPPHVTVTPESTAPQNISTGVWDRGTTSVQVRMHRSTDASTMVTVEASGRWK